MAEWAKSDVEPRIVPMGALFSPKSLIMGILQRYATKYAVAIDTLQLQAEVVDSIGENDPDACFVDGLYLEAGRWEDGLVEPKAKDVFAKLPLLKLTPKVVTQARPQTQSSGKPMPPAQQPMLPSATDAKAGSQEHSYKAPVYNTVTRAGPLTPMGQSANFVLCVALPSSLPEHLWIKRGSALFCQLPG